MLHRFHPPLFDDRGGGRGDHKSDLRVCRHLPRDLSRWGQDHFYRRSDVCFVHDHLQRTWPIDDTRIKPVQGLFALSVYSPSLSLSLPQTHWKQCICFMRKFIHSSTEITNETSKSNVTLGRSGNPSDYTQKQKFTKSTSLSGRHWRQYEQARHLLLIQHTKTSKESLDNVLPLLGKHLL